jgi:hypothetical protein
MVDDRHVDHDHGEKRVNGTEILARTERAVNEHDLDALAGCFAGVLPDSHAALRDYGDS